MKTSSPTTRAGTTAIGFDPQYLRKFQDKLFVEGPATGRRLLNYYVLLLLAAVIATYGLLSDSPATVIGAMIVAPLMQPIIATSAAVVMGSPRRALNAMALVLSGVILVILLSIVLTLMLPDIIISFESTNELISRVSPGLIALGTALASGAAGGFIATREEIADSLAGVAIAISLVPPLCVVGIALVQGHWMSAFGALLLFLTNFLAILFACGLVFLLLGLGRLANSESGKNMQRSGLILIVAATVLVAVPLTITSAKAVQSALEQRVAVNVASNWLGQSSAELVQVQVNGDEIQISVTGVTGLPVQKLANDLAAGLNRAIIVVVRQIPSEIVRTASGQPE